jgi:CheY-like chemotaxis protein
MGTGHHFIVVDDDLISNLICRFNIQKFDSKAEITLYTEPETALTVIEQTYGPGTRHLPTVLFLDINMPSMTGWEFLDKFENLPAHIHKQFIIYILSSSIEEPDYQKASLHPLVSGFLSKPLDLDSIAHIFSHKLQQPVRAVPD